MSAPLRTLTVAARYLPIVPILLCQSQSANAMWSVEVDDFSFAEPSVGAYSEGSSSVVSTSVFCDSTVQELVINVYTGDYHYGPQHLSGMNDRDPVLVLKVDGHPEIYKSAFIDMSDRGDLRLGADLSRSEVKDLAKAEERITVALQLGSDLRYETVFDTANGSSALNEVLSACSGAIPSNDTAPEEPTTLTSADLEVLLGGQPDDLDARLTEADRYPLGSRENPIRVDSPAGERAYLGRLRCQDGRVPEFERVGSFDEGVFGHIIDGYDVRCPGSEPRQSMIFMDMYFPDHLETRPASGFELAP